ncbi:sensor histidine kinase [Corynebacterium uterequi]|uniref:sensor histidine kinase n=1 Tax=Corynebacterium uterequi TaxID=1072256 RepID=UPI00064101C5
MAEFLPHRSLRWRIVWWIVAVVTVALFSVIFMSRSLLISEVSDNANAAVEQELEEFRRFATEGIDPATQQPFTSSARLIETFMSRQWPDDDELFIGRAEGNLITFDYTGWSGSVPPPVDTRGVFAREIFEAPHDSGVFHDPDFGDIHWGRVSVADDQPASLVVAYFTEEDRGEVASQVRVIVLVGLAALIASVLIAYFIAGPIIAPLRSVRHVAHSITNADLSQRVPVTGNDEITKLALTFNEMLDRLEKAYREQRQFVDDAGHELRTPITVVRGQLELLESTPPEQRARSIQLAIAELDRMSRMVTDMLTLALADSGNLVSTAPHDVAELMIDIEDKATTLSDRVSLVDVAEGVVNLDENRVTEAILELYGNALRYSDDEIVIGSEYIGEGADRMLQIWVRDRGPGISWDKQSTIFDRFTRAERNGNARPTGGAGLGLSIVAAIAEGHGGRAFVDSTRGLGSIFGIEIPALVTHREPREDHA